MYTLNPRMPRLRRDAAFLVRSGWSMRAVARHFGYHPSTIMRWCRKAPPDGRITIPTRSSRPKTSPKALDQAIVSEVIRLRRKHNRCASVVHQELFKEGIVVSLSSVRRALKRQQLTKPRSPWKRYHQSNPRPIPSRPGELVELDTIHCRTLDGQSFYVYTLLDVYSRWTYAEVSIKISTRASLAFVTRAYKAAPLRFKTIQTDHGSEFSTVVHGADSNQKHLPPTFPSQTTERQCTY